MKKLGKYQILEKIGTGGFGEVYKAYDPFIKRHTAAKTCNTDDQDTRNRFFQEAEIAGNLSHRNIVTVFDFGIEENLPYLIQEYLSGEDLDRKIKRRDALSYAEKLSYLVQIAHGLAYAHSQGVIHRDIKPANIRILADGTAKIMDFGIAKLAQQETGLTQTGMTLGTAAYLAPEQIRGEPIDHRTDIFSFGVMAYELLAQGRPFQGEQISTVLYQILHHEPPRLSESISDLPPGISTVIQRCLSKDPDGRYNNGEELARDLERIQEASRRLETEEVSTIPLQPIKPPPPLTGPTRLVAQQPEVRDAASDSAARRDLSGTGIDQIELSSTRAGEATTKLATGEIRQRAAAGRWLLTFALLVALGGAAWWIWRTTPWDKRSAVDEVAEADTADVDAATVDLPPVAGEPTPPPPKAAREEAPTLAPPPTAAPPPPAPPPPPTTGTLVVSQVPWSDAMTVQIDGGTSYPLSRPRQLTLSPGTHTLVFDLRQGDFSARRTVEITLAAGERQTVQAPIAEPGALTVQAGLGRPQGTLLLIDAAGEEKALGNSPLRGRRLEPGDYRLRIASLSGPGAIEHRLTLRSGRETVLTFDLDGGEVLENVKTLR